MASGTTHGGFYRSRVLASGAASPKQLDIAVILAAVHTDLPGTRHSPGDPRMQATLQRLEELFAAQYPINAQRPAGSGPAMGRYPGDVYYSGGAYYFSTLGAAELCYLSACRMSPAGGTILAAGAVTHFSKPSARSPRPAATCPNSLTRDSGPRARRGISHGAMPPSSAPRPPATRALAGSVTKS